MSLRQHLHFLIPSSDSTTLLEARLYLPENVDHPPNTTTHLSIWIDSLPLPASELSAAFRRELQALCITRVVVAAHPWGRLGGNMLDLVLSDHLMRATLYLPDGPTAEASIISKWDSETALITYNVRGVGASEGSSAWVTPGNDPMDFAAIEQWAVGALRPITEPVMDVFRFGYSWGCIAAVLAPLPSDPTSHRIRTIMLVSPPLSFLPVVTYFSGSFDRVLRGLLSAGDGLISTGDDGSSGPDSVAGERRTKVWTIYGDNDQFTGVAKYRSWVGGMPEMKAKEVEGDHFWRGRRAGEELEDWMRQWLADVPGGHRYVKPFDHSELGGERDG